MKINFVNILHNTGATVLIRGGSGIAKILLLLFIAKRFGPADFGRLSLVLSLVEIVRVIADFGVDVVTIRRFTVNRLLSGRLLSNALSLKLITATLGYVTAAVAYWLLYRNLSGLKLLFIVGISLYTTLIVNAFVSYFQANLKMSSIIRSNLISVFSYIVLALAGFLSDWPLEMFALIIPASELINLLLTLSIYKKTVSVTFELNRRVILSLLRESAPVAVGGIAVVLYLRLDNLMLGWFLGDRSVGIYSAAYRFIEPFTLVFSSLSISVYASLSSFRKSSNFHEVKRSLFRIIVPVIGVSACAALMLSIFAKQIMGIISPAYASSAAVLKILGMVILFRAISAQLVAFVNSRGRYLLVSSMYCVTLLISTVLYIVLIPLYGITGAAITTVLSEVTNTVMFVVLVIHLLRSDEGQNTGQNARTEG